MRTVLRAVAALLGLLLLAVLVRLGVAVHDVTPRADLGDLLGLAGTSNCPDGSLCDRIARRERVNVLLLAHGGAGGDNPDFTDTMIVLSIRPRSHAATAIALPRYLWVTIPAGPRADVQGKLYATYALAAEASPGFLRPEWTGPTGPGDLTAATVGATIGAPVAYWISVDTDTFAQLIDAIGGIRITIPAPLDDPTYPLGDSGRTTHVHFDAGTQTLDGTRALEYARSRLSTSDADRQRRQELVLVGILQRLRAPQWSVGGLWSLAWSRQGVLTNLQPGDISALAQLTRALHASDVARFTLDDSGLLQTQQLGGGEIEVPADGTFAAVRAYVAARLP